MAFENSNSALAGSNSMDLSFGLFQITTPRIALKSPQIFAAMEE